jgi:hypothetical protein
MADVKPLKLEYDGNGTPSGIGEFQSGDTVAQADLNITSLNSLTVNASVITVSSCPVPPPWSFVEVTSDDGVNSNEFYFASGSSQATTEIDAAHITWDSSESYFTIANAGYYEFEMQGSVIVGATTTVVTTSIIQTTGFGGTEVEKIDKDQTIRTNLDPHDVMIKWVGYVEADKNFTCKIEATALNRLQIGSTFTCKRIN